MTVLRVDYSRTVSEAGSFSSIRVGGSVELTLPKNADKDKEWENAYTSLKNQVDTALGVAQRPPPAQENEVAAEPSTATDEVSQDDATVADKPPTTGLNLAELAGTGTPVSLTKCRVMFDPRILPEQGRRREQVRMRLGCDTQIDGQYVNAKGEEPEVIGVMKNLRAGDMVDVDGHIDKPWNKSTENADGTTTNETRHDLIIQSIHRA